MRVYVTPAENAALLAALTDWDRFLAAVFALPPIALILWYCVLRPAYWTYLLIRDFSSTA